MDKITVFTNGCFYILTPGHIHLFKEIKRLFKCTLIVGINSNESLYRLKKRPAIIEDNDRLDLIKSIKYVDNAYIFKSDTPYNLIKRIKPDIIVKGDDYINKDIVGSDISSAITLIENYKKYSTTDILFILKNQ